MPLHFSALPSDVLDHIAFRVALLDILGPPTHLVPLLCTNSQIYNQLSLPRNPHLYARIFRAKFDYRASGRRFAQQATYSTALAAQLVRYCNTLKNIRHGDIYSPTLLNDFCRAFALCSENDGRNAEQLQWARLSSFAERYVFDRLWQDRQLSHNWPVESPENAFALWLYWFSLSPHKLASHTEQQRTYLQTLLRPYAVYNFRYPPFFAPDNHFRFPLLGSLELYNNHSAETPHGYYPQYRDPKYVHHSFPHYDDRITIAEPPIGLVAKLLYVALLEHQPQDYPPPDLLPQDRIEADEIGALGPTLADYYEFGNLRAALPPEPGHWDWHTTLNDNDGAREDSRSWSVDLKSLSARQENDWERWRGCYNPWDDNLTTRGVTYTFGSLNGLWAGRYLDPTIDDFLLAVNSSVFVPELEHPEITVTSNPLFFRLREHHCISPARPLPHWEVIHDPLDEGIMNAYCPRDFPHAYSITERDGKLYIRKRGSLNEYVYETYHHGRANSHDEDTCMICAATRDAELEQRMASVHGHDYDDNDAEMLEYDETDTLMYEPSGHEDDVAIEDARDAEARSVVQHALGYSTDLEAFIERVAREPDADDASMYSAASSETGDDYTEVARTCSGILDIIITGETPRRHALAWRDFRIYGRVRSWDGLIVLVRAPVHTGPHPPLNDTYVFRGYLIGGKTLVGSWRHVTDSVHSIPLEGTFVVSKIDDPEDTLANAQNQSDGACVQATA